MKIVIFLGQFVSCLTERAPWSLHLSFEAMFYYEFIHFCWKSVLKFIFLDLITLNEFYYDHSYSLKWQNSAVDATFLCTVFAFHVKSLNTFVRIIYKKKIERVRMSSEVTWEGSQHKDYCEDLHDEQEDGNLQYKRINWLKSAEHFTHFILVKTFCLIQVWIVDMLVFLTEEFPKKIWFQMYFLKSLI